MSKSPPDKRKVDMLMSVDKEFNDESTPSRLIMATPTRAVTEAIQTRGEIAARLPEMTACVKGTKMVVNCLFSVRMCGRGLRSVYNSTLDLQ